MSNASAYARIEKVYRIVADADKEVEDGQQEQETDDDNVDCSHKELCKNFTAVILSARNYTATKRILQSCNKSPNALSRNIVTQSKHLITPKTAIFANRENTKGKKT